jgi:hypothetical protein
VLPLAELPAKSVVARHQGKIILVFCLVLIAGGLFWQQVAGLLSQTHTPTVQGASASSRGPDLSGFSYSDNQNGVEVIAQYLPSESTARSAAVQISISSATVDLRNWDYKNQIIWANSDIDPMPTLGSSDLKLSQNNFFVKMRFGKDARSHYHLLVNNLGGIKNRVLHFYLNGLGQ